MGWTITGMKQENRATSIQQKSPCLRRKLLKLPSQSFPQPPKGSNVHLFQVTKEVVYPTVNVMDTPSQQ